MTDPADFQWLVEQRSKNQKLLLDLYAFGHAKQGVLPNDAAACATFHLLTGAVFSLWRAVFLTEQETTTQDRFDHSIRFLEKLVRDNAITYTQDRETKSWTAGYYLNNAYCRLSEAVNALSPHLERATGTRDDPEEFRSFRNANNSEVVSTDRRRAWEIAHAAASKVLMVVRELLP